MKLIRLVLVTLITFVSGSSIMAGEMPDMCDYENYRKAEKAVGENSKCRLLNGAEQNALINYLTVAAPHLKRDYPDITYTEIINKICRSKVLKYDEKQEIVSLEKALSVDYIIKIAQQINNKKRTIKFPALEQSPYDSFADYTANKKLMSHDRNVIYNTVATKLTNPQVITNFIFQAKLALLQEQIDFNQYEELVDSLLKHMVANSLRKMSLDQELITQKARELSKNYIYKDARSSKPKNVRFNYRIQTITSPSHKGNHLFPSPTPAQPSTLVGAKNASPYSWFDPSWWFSTKELSKQPPVGISPQKSINDMD